MAQQQGGFNANNLYQKKVLKSTRRNLNFSLPSNVKR